MRTIKNNQIRRMDKENDSSSIPARHQPIRKSRKVEQGVNTESFYEALHQLNNCMKSSIFRAAATTCHAMDEVKQNATMQSDSGLLLIASNTP